MVPGAKGFPGDAKRLAFQLDFTTHVLGVGPPTRFWGKRPRERICRFSRKKLDDSLIDKSPRKGRRRRIKLFQERGEMFRDGVVDRIVLCLEALPDFPQPWASAQDVATFG
jgi:hypothetical protein